MTSLTPHLKMVIIQRLSFYLPSDFSINPTKSEHLSEFALGAMMFLQTYTKVFAQICVHQTSPQLLAGFFCAAMQRRYTGACIGAPVHAPALPHAHKLFTFTRICPVCCVSTKVCQIAESPHLLSGKIYPWVVPQILRLTLGLGFAFKNPCGGFRVTLG